MTEIKPQNPIVLWLLCGFVKTLEQNDDTAKNEEVRVNTKFPILLKSCISKRNSLIKLGRRYQKVLSESWLCLLLSFYKVIYPEFSFTKKRRFCRQSDKIFLVEWSTSHLI